MDRTELAGRVLSTHAIAQVLGLAERVAGWPRDHLAVLTYHRVAPVPDDGSYGGLVSATPEDFARQIDVIAERFTVVDVDAVVDAVDRGAPLPDRAVLLTFDDAVDDFHRYAWPVLRSAGLPGALFVPTGYVGDDTTPFWWDALHAAVTTTARNEPLPTPVGPVSLDDDEARSAGFRRLRDHLKEIPFDEVGGIVDEICAACDVRPPPARVMSWAQLREVATAGIACCPHTRTHPHLDRLPSERAHEEIEGSVDDLRQHLGGAPPVFAYPAGRFDDAVVDLVRRSGLRVAFGTHRGLNDVAADDPLTFRRINLSRRTGLAAVRAQMLPPTDRLLSRWS